MCEQPTFRCNRSPALYLPNASVRVTSFHKALPFFVKQHLHPLVLMHLWSTHIILQPDKHSLHLPLILSHTPFIVCDSLCSVITYSPYLTMSSLMLHTPHMGWMVEEGKSFNSWFYLSIWLHLTSLIMKARPSFTQAMFTSTYEMPAFLLLYHNERTPREQHDSSLKRK